MSTRASGLQASDTLLRRGGVTTIATKYVSLADYSVRYFLDDAIYELVNVVAVREPCKYNFLRDLLNSTGYWAR